MYLLIVLGAPPSTMRSLIILCISIFVMRRSVRIETRLRVFRVAILTIFLFSSIPSIRHTTSSSFPLPHSTIIQPRPKSPTPCTMIHKLQPSFTQPQQQPPPPPPPPPYQTPLISTSTRTPSHPPHRQNPRLHQNAEDPFS